MAYSNVVWQTPGTNVSISGNTVTGNGSASSWTSNCRTVGEISTGTSVKFTVNNSHSNSKCMAGLGEDPETASQQFQAIEYALTFDSGQWDIYESGSHITTASGGTSTSEARVERDGTTIKYYIDDTLEYTSLVTTSSTLYGQFAAKYQGECTMQSGQPDSGGSGGGDGETPSTPIAGESAIIENILYLNTRVPK